jgi:hypothetical protein
VWADDEEGQYSGDDDANDKEEQERAGVASLLARRWGGLFHGWWDACFDLAVVHWWGSKAVSRVLRMPTDGVKRREWGSRPPQSPFNANTEERY